MENITELESLLVNLIKQNYSVADSNLRKKVTETDIKVSLLISWKNIDDLINLSFSSTFNKRLLIKLTFDHLPKNNRTLDLLNEYNKHNHIFKAYINDSGNLEVTAFMINSFTEESITTFVQECFTYSEDKSHIDLIKPLTDITYE
jgi:hypothetical protein